MYDTRFIVKYKEIEEELLRNIENKQRTNVNDKDGDEDEYTVEDIYMICEELYRHELLCVFQVKRLDEKQMENTMTEIWNKININFQMIEIINLYSQKMAK